VAVGILTNADDTVAKSWWSLFRALVNHGADLHLANTDNKTPLLCLACGLFSKRTKPTLVKWATILHEENISLMDYGECEQWYLQRYITAHRAP
jgi:hypothetical protein